MLSRFTRPFTIKTKFEAYLVMYGLAVGACERGVHYIEQYPGAGGWAMFLLCPVAVLMAGGRILDSIEREQAEG